MTGAKNDSGKGTVRKGPPAGSDDNLHKRIESERISAHIADFEKAGGQVEKLGVTRVLQKIAPVPVVPAKPVPKPRPRKGG